MKIKFFITLLSIAFLLSNCEKDTYCVYEQGDKVEQEYEVSGFDGIHVKNMAKVHLTQSDTFSVKIKGYQSIIDNLIVYVKDNTLVIENDKCANQSLEIIVRVSMPFVKDLYLSGTGGFLINPFDNFEDLFVSFSGSGYIYNLKDTMRLDKLHTTISGYGYLSLYLVANELDIDVSGSAYVIALGNANSIKFSLAGSTSYHGFGLQTKFSDIIISGEGNLEVFASEKLDINFSGSGKVFYKGYPTITSRITGEVEIIDSN